jgi:hypothetical protein
VRRSSTWRLAVACPQSREGGHTVSRTSTTQAWAVACGSQALAIFHKVLVGVEVVQVDMVHLVEVDTASVVAAVVAATQVSSHSISLMGLLACRQACHPPSCRVWGKAAGRAKRHETVEVGRRKRRCSGFCGSSSSNNNSCSKEVDAITGERAKMEVDRQCHPLTDIGSFSLSVVGMPGS